MTTRYPFAVIKEKLHARRGELADFAIGARKLALDPEIAAWVEGNPSLALEAASPDDVAAFRQAAVDYLMEEYAAEAAPDNVLPVPGGRVGMSAFMACVVEPGTGVVTTEPGYPAFARMAAHRHARLVSVTLDPERQFMPNVAGLRDDNGIGVVALNYPNNPTAAVLTEETRTTIDALARANDAVVFNDAVYGPLTYDGRATGLLSPDAGTHAQFVELHSLTKLYPLGPLSGSFLVGSDDPMHSIATYSEFAWSPMSALQMRATTMCLGDTEGRARIRDFYRDQLDALRETLTGLGFRPYPTPAGIYVLCPNPARLAGKPVEDAQTAAALLMDEFGIAAMPWDVDGSSYLRFSSMYRAEEIARLAALGDRLEPGY